VLVGGHFVSRLSFLIKRNNFKLIKFWQCEWSGTFARCSESAQFFKIGDLYFKLEIFIVFKRSAELKNPMASLSSSEGQSLAVLKMQ